MSEKMNAKSMQLMLKPNLWIQKWKIENLSKDYFKMNCEEKIAL